MTTAKIEGSFALMKDQGTVDSGEAVAAGIGAMNQRRIQDFGIQMVKAVSTSRARSTCRRWRRCSFSTSASARTSKRS